VGIQDDEFVTAHRGEYRKIKNIRNDGRVALFVFSVRRGLRRGLLEYVVAYGTARVTDGGRGMTMLTAAWPGSILALRQPSRHRLLGIGPGLVIHIPARSFRWDRAVVANSALAVFRFSLGSRRRGEVGRGGPGRIGHRLGPSGRDIPSV